MLSPLSLIRCNHVRETIKPICQISVRYFSPKSYPMNDGTYRGDMPRRFGYEAHHHTEGLLPRLRIKEKRAVFMPLTAKEDPWASHKAREGENDFIKILSDQDIEQHDLLTHIPDWLRGYKDSRFEYHMLLRKKKEFAHWQYSKPLKWSHLEARIKFLYKRLNNKFKPPEVEKMHRSRYMS